MSALVSSSVKPPDHKLTGKNRLRLADMLFRRHYRLLRAFEVADEPKKGVLPAATVCGIFKTVLGLDIKWPALLPSLVGNLQYKDGDPINYEDMLSRFSSRQAAPIQQQVTWWTALDCVINWIGYLCHECLEWCAVRTSA